MKTINIYAKLSLSLVCGLATICGLVAMRKALTNHQEQAKVLTASPMPSISKPATTDQPAQARAMEAFGQLPLSFEINRGQADARVKYLARGSGYGLFLTATEAILQLRKPDAGKRNQTKQHATKSQSAVVRMKLSGANPTPQMEGLDELPGKSNYFIGNDPSQWRSNIAHYARVRYREVYPGIDLIYYGNQQQLEYDFIIAPGADPDVIKLSFTGVDGLRVDGQGDLVLQTAGGEFRHHKPVVWQEAHGVRREIAGRYLVEDHGQVGFAVDAYDDSRPLVIDPVLSYATYLGGSNYDEGMSLATDAAGNVYVMGYTQSPNFPAIRAVQGSSGGGTCGTAPNTYPCSDVFVTKLNPAGTTVIYSTYLGGNGSEGSEIQIELNGGLAVDAAGAAYLTGGTASTNFPITTGALQSTLGGNSDVFVTKLSPSGSALIYSTYLGGASGETGHDIAVDGTGQAYMTGVTYSANFPTMNPLPGRCGGSFFGSAYVTRLNPTGTALSYSTCLGGEGSEGNGIAVDAAGSAYVIGTTLSSSFPAVNPIQAANGGGWDVFISKLHPSGSSLIFSTYLGGSDQDYGNRIAIDSAGNCYVTGYTTSPNFPTANPFQSQRGGSEFSTGDAFVAKINAAGSALAFSTYLGGSDYDEGYDIAVDGEGKVYVTGATGSSGFPLLRPLQNTFQGGLGTSRIKTRVSGSSVTFLFFVVRTDAFVTVLNAAGSALVYSTFLGGSGDDFGGSVAVDAASNVYVVGGTNASNFPVTSGVFQTTFGGGTCPGSPCKDAFIARIGADAPVSNVTNVSAASFLGLELAPESIVAAFGTGLATQTVVATDADPNTPGIQLPTELAGTTVEVKDSAGTTRRAPLFFVSPTQVNYLTPSLTAAGGGIVTIKSGDGKIATGTVQAASVAPGLFTASASGQGVAAGVALRVRGNSQTFEPIAEFDPAQNKFVAKPIDLGPEGDQVFLILYGVGFRFRSALSAVSVKIGGAEMEVLYAAEAPGFIGLDQLNVRFARSLMGRGEVDVMLTVNGKTANTVKVSFK